MKTDKKEKQLIRRIGRVCGWLGLTLLLFTLLTGYGIVEFRIITPLTFHWLNKAVAQRLHAYTEVPMLVLLLTHIGIALWMRRIDAHKKG
jgi:cytochrome b subunit of formate dehydrogenase